LGKATISTGYHIPRLQRHGLSATATQEISYKQKYFKNWKGDKISSESITQSHQECMKKITGKSVLLLL